MYFTYQSMLLRIFFYYCLFVLVYLSVSLSTCLFVCPSVCLCLGLRPHFGSRGQVVRPFVSDTSPNVLTEKAWEDAVYTGTRQKRDLESRLRQTTHVSLYHLTMFSLYTCPFLVIITTEESADSHQFYP